MVVDVSVHSGYVNERTLVARIEQAVATFTNVIVRNRQETSRRSVTFGSVTLYINFDFSGRNPTDYENNRTASTEKPKKQIVSKLSVGKKRLLPLPPPRSSASRRKSCGRPWSCQRGCPERTEFASCEREWRQSIASLTMGLRWRRLGFSCLKEPSCREGFTRTIPHRY